MKNVDQEMISSMARVIPPRLAPETGEHMRSVIQALNPDATVTIDTARANRREVLNCGYRLFGVSLASQTGRNLIARLDKENN